MRLIGAYNQGLVARQIPPRHAFKNSCPRGKSTIQQISGQSRVRKSWKSVKRARYGLNNPQNSTAYAKSGQKPPWKSFWWIPNARGVRYILDNRLYGLSVGVAKSFARWPSSFFEAGASRKCGWLQKQGDSHQRNTRFRHRDASGNKSFQRVGRADKQFQFFVLSAMQLAALHSSQDVRRNFGPPRSGAPSRVRGTLLKRGKAVRAGINQILVNT